MTLWFFNIRNIKMKEDWEKFTPLQKILVIIDLILNPKAPDYPFLYSDGFIEKLPPNHFGVKGFVKDGKHWVWCIRWI